LAAIAGSNLTAGGSGTDGTSYTTASIAPTGNRLVLAAVASARGADPATPTLSGGGMTTWTLVESVGINGFVRLSVFRSLQASPSSGTLGISFGAETQERCTWAIMEHTNVLTSGANGADAIRQADSAAAADALTISVTLAAFGDVNNATYGALMNQDIGVTTIAPGTDFTEINEVGIDDAGVGQSLASEFRADNDTTVDGSMNAECFHLGVVGIEIVNATPSSSGAVTGRRMLLGVGQ